MIIGKVVSGITVFYWTKNQEAVKKVSSSIAFFFVIMGTSYVFILFAVSTQNGVRS
jgi:hypothetical protein